LKTALNENIASIYYNQYKALLNKNKNKQMKKQVMRLMTLCIIGSVIFTSCKKNNDVGGKPMGFIYTTTNGESTNQVVSFSRFADGSISDEKAYSTNSKGGADITMGGDAHGDFDAQGGVQIIGNYLLNVNAGGNTVSVFSLDRSNGNLTFKNNTPSGGTRPVGIAFTKKTGSESDYWLVVANQWNNPNVQKDGAMIERYPNNAFHQMNLKTADATDNQRNIQLFSFNASTGTLTSERQLDNYVRENGGPTTVSFSDDGSKLAVTTWGIAHFSTMNPSLAEQKPSRVYVYNFSNGNVSGERFFEEEGIAGTIGFNWAKGSNTRLFVSNFNLTTSKINNSVTVLSDNGTNVTKSAALAVTSTQAINEACWTVLNPAGNKLYVASFATNLVSTFNVTESGLTLSSSEARSGIAPMGDSKDVYVTPDNKYLYNLGSFKSYSINGFAIDGSGVDYKSQTFLATAISGKGVPGKFNFLGLTGFDIK
jgi:6-phosphogluconolactonase (cycloisomerase 2 family)